MQHLVSHRRIAVRSPHGAGKTCVAAWVVLWGILTADDVKVVTTASAWRQLTKFLWPEVHKWAARLRWDILGRMPFDPRTEEMQLSIKLGHQREAFPVASDNPAFIEGAHAKRIVYVYDEAKAIPDGLWDAAEGAFSTAGIQDHEVYALAISTPGIPAGRFYDIHRRAAGYEDWWTRHITLDEVIAADRISETWARQRAIQWGEDNPVYLNRVLGEFASDPENSVIMLPWVEAAIERWHEINDESAWEPFTSLGVDVGRGSNPTVIAIRHGDAIKEIRTNKSKDTMIVAGIVHGILESVAKSNTKAIPRAIVDVIGVGAGVVDRLREYGHKFITAFNAGESTDRRDTSGELTFMNKRSAMWWRMRDMLSPSSPRQVALPPDDDLVVELTMPTWSETQGGRIKVEPKLSISGKLSSRAGRDADTRSTDKADAVLQAFWDDDVEKPPTLRYLRAAGLYRTVERRMRNYNRRASGIADLRRGPKENY